MKRINVNAILWVVYLALLGVLLPHTAWTFSKFEPAGDWNRAVAWLAAFAFEAAIAALTHKLARHIETTPRYTSGLVWLRKLSYRYLNAYSLGLLVAIGVSMAANLAHAVEFGQSLLIFSSSPVLAGLYSVAFGAILPLVSLLFARVLSNVAETEQEANPELIKANETIKDLRQKVRQASVDIQRLEEQVKQTERRANEAELRFGAAGDLFARLFAEEKRVRILAIAEQWPELPQRSIALMANTSPSHVSAVLQQEREQP